MARFVAICYHATHNHWTLSFRATVWNKATQLFCTRSKCIRKREHIHVPFSPGKHATATIYSAFTVKYLDKKEM